MDKIKQKISDWLLQIQLQLSLSTQTKKGIISALVVVSILFCISVTKAITFGVGRFPDIILEITAGTAILAIITATVYILLQAAFALGRMVGWLVISMFIALLIFIKQFNIFTFPITYFTPPIITSAILGGAIAAIISKWFKRTSIIKKVVVLIICIAAFGANVYYAYWMFNSGSDEHLTVKTAPVKSIPQLQVENPSQPGNYKTLELTYGSSNNKRRLEFGENADIKTPTVDASPFAGVWGRQAKFRKWFWGFDFTRCPLNGLVWYPDGEGPFPLVVMVHGNHFMAEFSDPGYEYLGKLLASRGFICVSVDENFLNSLLFGQISGENDARGWLLLKHLKLWKEWNSTEDNVFYNKVDMDNIALIGHSRGGDAVVIASALNKLEYWSDDANITFDFNFNIKSVVTIGPVDGQYRPSGKFTPLENINYLVLQGGHDAAAYFFMGKRQFERLAFTDSNYWFKSSFYIYRANHNKFNTVWGDYDFPLPYSLWLNQKPLLKGEEQRQIAKIYISAFIEATLHKKKEYIPLFRDHRKIADWLPNDIYINRFEDSYFKSLCTFDEDIDLTTGTVKGVKISTNDLMVWNESQLRLRHLWESNYNTALAIGWRKYTLRDKGEIIPSYCITLPDSLSHQWNLNAKSLFTFSLAPTPYFPPELSNEIKEQVMQDTTRHTHESSRKSTAFDLSIEFTMSDSTHKSVSLPLSYFATVPPVLKSKFTKFKDESMEYFSDTEITFQIFELPLSAFVEKDPEFDPSKIKHIRFVLDKLESGVIVIDQIGFGQSSLEQSD